MYFFFFQAEDGIRDDLVTGVQTCALPILPTLLYKDVFSNFKLKAEVVLTPTPPQPHAHSLLFCIEFKVTLFQFLRTIFGPSIGLRAYRSEAIASYQKFLTRRYEQLLQHTWYYVTSNKQINLLIYSQWSV